MPSIFLFMGCEKKREEEEEEEEEKEMFEEECKMPLRVLTEGLFHFH